MTDPDPGPDCVFCRIVAGELPSTIVAQDERTVAFMDISPATRGHVLVIPRAHSRDLLEIEAEDLAAVAAMGRRVAAVATRALHADGVNLLNSCGATAWQTVFHFHLHVIPRYADDGMRLPWTPAPGDPDEIQAAGVRLKGAM
jgi:histidine triad (HIT) family protein